MMTLCASLDELLGGGLWAGEVTEVVGGTASGKVAESSPASLLSSCCMTVALTLSPPHTQQTALCLQACASVLSDPTATIAFVDSANAFTPTRLLPLLPFVQLLSNYSY
jgi:hypothetical protein